MSDTKERRIELWAEQAELKETNYRDPATDEYEYNGELWSGKHLICRFEEDCEDAPRLFMDAHNTANEVDMLPSELLAKLREAAQAIERLKKQVDLCDYRDGMHHELRMNAAYLNLITLNLPKP